VNARHTKNLPGRKSDVQESQPVVAEVAYLWVAEQLLPPGIDNPHTTYLLATTRRKRGGSGDLHSTDAESTDPDEPAIGQRD